ncbi:MAG: phosphoglycerate dehydrogenase [Desulfobacteraceae bacterium]|nr:phosphoglycerate dehydrogenase [Desulfobacteraceae bacterium]
MTCIVAIGPSSFAEKDKQPLEMLFSAGVEVINNPFSRRLTEEEIITHLHGVHGLIAGLEPLNARVLKSANQLKAIARVGIGMDNVDQQAASQLGIRVSNTPDEPAAAVAELTMGALLSLNRGLMQANQRMHAGIWQKEIGTGLNGAKALIIGYGRTGRRMAQLLINFGVSVMVVDPFLQEPPRPEIALVELEEGLRQADIVSLHASGRDLILGRPQFYQIKKGAILLNSARGELLEEAALVDALKEGRIRGAWLDVYWEEPYRGPLTAFEQVLLTPHIGTYTNQCRLQMETSAVSNLLRDLGIA